MTDRQKIESFDVPPYATQRAFEEYGSKLDRFLRRRVRSSHDARDLAQETYLRFMQVARQEEIRNPQALLYRLASNLVYEFRVRERYSRVVYDSEDAQEHGCSTETGAAEDMVDQMSLSQEVKRVLEELPKPLQAVLLLRKCAGFTPEEIAQRLGLTKSTVSAYLVRAVAHFKAAQFGR